MSRYIKQEDAVFAACKVLDKFGGCKMGAFCPDVGCSEVRDIIDTFNIIDVPDNHGRLIDADALINELVHAEFFSMTDYNKFVSLALKAPTIIPAEEGE